MTISHLTKESIKKKKEKNQRVGRWIQYGWKLADDGINLLPHPQEQKIAAIAKELRSKGLSLRAIGRELERRKLLPRSKRTWSAKGISTVLKTKMRIET
jgi:hypothetical protein